MAAEQEYEICSENIRQYDRTFFAHLTVFIAVNGALMTLFTSHPPPQDWVLRVGKTAGLIVGAVFWVNAEIYLYRYHHFLARAADLEASLGCKQYSTMLERRHPWWRRPGSWAWRSLFVFSLLFWVKTLL